MQSKAKVLIAEVFREYRFPSRLIYNKTNLHSFSIDHLISFAALALNSNQAMSHTTLSCFFLLTNEKKKFTDCCYYGSTPTIHSLSAFPLKKPWISKFCYLAIKVCSELNCMMEVEIISPNLDLSMYIKRYICKMDQNGNF